MISYAICCLLEDDIRAIVELRVRGGVSWIDLPMLPRTTYGTVFARGSRRRRCVRARPPTAPPTAARHDERGASTPDGRPYTLHVSFAP
ncbi:hypothetical protein [Sorangium sp. So ce394]|uniref:hypothetical protein n=1 Tax=Sorangium sp. So ce394 TaxID=3133310 RepID=UPI003F5B7E87